MRRSKKKLPTKASFSHFSKLIPQILGLKSGKGIRVTKIANEKKFEGHWGKLESKTGFQRQSLNKYLRLNLVFT